MLAAPQHNRGNSAARGQQRCWHEEQQRRAVPVQGRACQAANASAQACARVVFVFVCRLSFGGRGVRGRVCALQPVLPHVPPLQRARQAVVSPVHTPCTMPCSMLSVPGTAARDATTAEALHAAANVRPCVNSSGKIEHGPNSVPSTCKAQSAEEKVTRRSSSQRGTVPQGGHFPCLCPCPCPCSNILAVCHLPCSLDNNFTTAAAAAAAAILRPTCTPQQPCFAPGRLQAAAPAWPWPSAAPHGGPAGAAARQTAQRLAPRSHSLPPGTGPTATSPRLVVRHEGR